jgi:uncharacterized protein (TIGR00290 family)
MGMKEKVLLSWGGGKDSALALQELQVKSQCEVWGLLTTVSEEYDRISLHGVRRILLERQAESIGLPLDIIYIPRDASNEIYESRMKKALEKHLSKGVSGVVFGDIFLEDVRKHRESNLARTGMGASFPLWKRDTAELARMFLDLGFKAIVTCVDSDSLSGNFVGRQYDEGFLSDIPPGVDPCGENGEFHTFVYDGPILRDKLSFTVGDTVLRDNRFYFCDLIPK